MFAGGAEEGASGPSGRDTQLHADLEEEATVAKRQGGNQDAQVKHAMSDTMILNCRKAPPRPSRFLSPPSNTQRSLPRSANMTADPFLLSVTCPVTACE
jgi:hypothetical protein